MPGIASLGTLVGIHSSYYAPPYHPGYTPCSRCTSRIPVIAVPGVPLPDDEALGSKKEKPLGIALCAS